MPPDAAIIIPCFNNSTYIREAIQSAIKQEGPAIEILVVDDGSTDNSVEIARTFGDKIKLIQQPNQGACAARNRGLAETSAPLIKFLDGDDYLASGCLERQVQAMATIPRDSLVFGDAEWVDANGVHIMHFRLEQAKAGTELTVSEVIRSTPLTSCPLHRREHLLQVGGFDPRCLRSQEFDLHVRLAISGFKFTYLPGCVYRYRQHSSTDRISHRDKDPSVQINRFQALERMAKLAQHELDDNQMRDAFNALGAAFWRLGRTAARSSDRKLARQCFSRALELGGRNSAVGSKLYRLLAKIIDPAFLD